MSLTVSALLATISLFILMLLAFALGRRVGVSQHRNNSELGDKGFSASEGAVFALLGLVIAFTFSGAGSRFEARRALINEEANHIGTAYLRLDLLGPEAQEKLREAFKSYAEIRSTPPDLWDSEALRKWSERTSAAQNAIWSDSVAASQQSSSAPQAAMLLLPAINSMIDITTTRQTAMDNHPPAAIFVLMGALSLVTSFLIGHSTGSAKRTHWLQPALFAALISLACYLIIDLEFPRAGWIRIDSSDQILRTVRSAMDQ